MRQHQIITTIKHADFPTPLFHMPGAPESMRLWGELPKTPTRYLTIIGSRKHTTYGEQVVEQLIQGLRGYNITIVSGLALGIDAIAHEEALKNGLRTIAVPGSGIDFSVMHPPSNRNLAERIVEAGGTILSPFDDTQPAIHWTFPVRNQIMAGLADAVLVIEAKKKSGTLITAKFAADYSRTVMAVPGSITSPHSHGTNDLIRDGAVPITCPEDILTELQFTLLDSASSSDKYYQCSPEERKILDLINQPIQKSELIRAMQMLAPIASAILTSMELKGLIIEKIGYVYRK